MIYVIVLFLSFDHNRFVSNITIGKDGVIFLPGIEFLATNPRGTDVFFLLCIKEMMNLQSHALI